MLQHASPHKQTLIIAALETGCRLGELLALVWRDVNLSPTDGAIYLRAATKTGKARAIPTTSRLRRAADAVQRPGRRTVASNGERVRQ